MNPDRAVQEAYQLASERYARLGVDTPQVMETLRQISLTIQCWQGDDVVGFERSGGAASSGGIQVTGGYPGRARTIEELRSDLEHAYSLIPGRHRLNLHAMYGDFGGRSVDRNEVLPEHFRSWLDWAAEERLGLDFNATCFAHPKADSGFTLSSLDEGVRRFWIEHVQRCRAISAFIGGVQGTPCVHNLWIPDGSKDTTVSRWTHRAALKSSLDEIFSTAYDARLMKDAVESKLFGIGSESFVVGSHEFYLAYALTHGKMLCIDMGHFHPTESVADKISAILQFADSLLLHVSRGVRWDSDHVVILNDELRTLAEEIVRSGVLHRVTFALDYFDASVNRVGAWVIGARATLKSLLIALLEPGDRLRQLEAEGDLFGRLALLEESKSLPHGAVWDYYCATMNVPPGEGWVESVREYERKVLRGRS